MVKILDLNKIRGVANYQFGRDVGHALFPSNVEIVYSKKTGRIRYVYLEGNLLATLRPKDGMISLMIKGAKNLLAVLEKPRLRVVIRDDVKEYILKGGDVFAKHVILADKEIRASEDVIVTDGNDNVLAVGKALLSGKEMLVFKRGIAVKVRRGRMEEEKKCEG